MYSNKSFDFFDQLGIQPDITCREIAASPLGFHALQKIPGDLYIQFPLPFFDQLQHGLVQQGLMPRVHHLFALSPVAVPGRTVRVMRLWSNRLFDPHLGFFGLTAVLSKYL